MAPAGTVVDEVSTPEIEVQAAFEFARAKLLAEESEFDGALDAYRRSLALDGDDPYAHVELARFESYLGQISQGAGRQREHFELAAEHIEEARALAPENLDVLRNYAQLYLRLAESDPEALDRARSAFEQLRASVEGDLQVLSSLGQIYLWQRETDKAIDALGEAWGYLPNHRVILKMLVDAYYSGGRAAEAEEPLRRLVGIEPTVLENHLRLAELISQRGDHSQALTALADVPPTLRESPRFRQARARELHLDGRHDEALKGVDSLRRDGIDNSAIGRLRLAVLSALTRYEEALTELDALAGDDGPALEDTLLASRLLERSGRSEEAIERLSGRLGEGPALQVAITLAGVLERAGDIAGAEELLRGALDQAEEGRLVALAGTFADFLARHGQGGEALIVLRSAGERLDAGDSGRELLMQQQLGRLIAEDRWQEADEIAHRLLASEVESVRQQSRLVYASGLAESGRVDEALGLLRAGGADRPVVARRARILFAAGRDDEAHAAIAGLSDGDGADGPLFAAQIYQAVQRYADSIRLLEGYLESEPESIQALFLLGAALERSGASDRASEVFSRLLDQLPNHAPTLNYLGYMWADSGQKLDRALELIRRAVAQEPDNGAFVDSLGWVYYRLGRYQEARPHLEWAARLVPDDATVYEHLGDLYVALDEPERARVAYQQAVDLDDENGEAVRRKLELLERKDL